MKQTSGRKREKSMSFIDDSIGALIISDLLELPVSDMHNIKTGNILAWDI